MSRLCKVFAQVNQKFSRHVSGLKIVLTIDTFRADGSFTGSSDKKNSLPYKTLPYGRTLGFRAGRCVGTGTREFQLTFYAVTWNKEGVVDLIERVPTTMTLSESGDEFTEHGNWEFLNLNWTVVFSGASDVKDTRLETPDQD